MLGRKPRIGYQKDPKKKKTKKKSYLSALFISGKKHHVSFNEKIVKFLIYIALRLVIRPKK